jgi:hypothetical protein
MKFGGIEFSDLVGGYKIENLPINKLPEQVATAMGAINSGLLGATYDPIRYVGSQVVNGMNYMFIAKEVRTTKDSKKAVVVVIINIPAGDLQGANAKVVDIIEECDLSPEVQDAFDAAVGQLVGVNYKPLVFVGSQVVKGTNYYIICSQTPVYPNAEPNAVLVTINAFNNKYTVVGIEPIDDVQTCEESNGKLGAPLGEWP